MARRRQISKPRTNKSFRRIQGTKPPRSITLIVCEGETEQYYFDAARIHFGLTTAEVILADNTIGSAPICVVQLAEAKSQERGGYDRIYCVFDRDGHESFDRARQRIRALAGRLRNSLPISEAVSIPCFELWVLLHLEQTTAPFHRCSDVIDRVRRHWPHYRKADKAVSEQLMTQIGTALTNAEMLERHAAVNAYNPFTSVHNILKYFKEVGNQ